MDPESPPRRRPHISTIFARAISECEGRPRHAAYALMRAASLFLHRHGLLTVDITDKFGPRRRGQIFRRFLACRLNRSLRNGTSSRFWRGPDRELVAVDSIHLDQPERGFGAAHA